MGGGRKGRVERGGSIYRAGRERRPEQGTGTDNFLKSSENFVLFFLVDAKLPGEGFMFFL